MFDYIWSRAKAFVALAVPGITMALMVAFEKATSFDIPPTTEAWVLVTVGGMLAFLGVERTANS